MYDFDSSTFCDENFSSSPSVSGKLYFPSVLHSEHKVHGMQQVQLSRNNNMLSVIPHHGFSLNTEFLYLKLDTRQQKPSLLLMHFSRRK